MPTGLTHDGSASHGPKESRDDGRSGMNGAMVPCFLLKSLQINIQPLVRKSNLQKVQKLDSDLGPDFQVWKLN